MTHHTTDTQASNTAGLVLLAAFAGAAAALLFAPKKGTDMREELKGRYHDMKTKSQDSAGDIQTKVADSVDAASAKMKDTADRTKEAADQASDKARASKRGTSNKMDENDTLNDTEMRTRL